MKLKDLLAGSPKAQLQSFHMYWVPGREISSDRERLAADLLAALADYQNVRRRFDTLPKASQTFIVSLLAREGFSGTVAEVREERRGRSIEAFEVEGILKSLQESGYLVKTGGSGGYSGEIFSIPEEIAEALRRTIAVEDRRPMEILSLAAALRRGEPGSGARGRGGLSAGAGAPHGGGGGLVTADPEVLAREAMGRVEALRDRELRVLVRRAIGDHVGILARSGAPEVRWEGTEWRRELEDAGLGTAGILSLRDCGIDLEEEGLFIFQEIVRAVNCEDARKEPHAIEREISLGPDLIIDIDRALEVLRNEILEVTREGNVYRKIEERLAGNFVTAQVSAFHDGSAVGHILELLRRLQFFEEEGQKIRIDPLHRKVWRKKPLIRKVDQVLELYRNDHRGHRWSFHQATLRRIFLDHLRAEPRDRWLVARPFLTAVISTYLLSLDELQVAREYQERCAGDFRHETLVVPFARLYLDLSYWVVHRLALLGILDVGYQAGSFHCLRLSTLGARLFEYKDTAAPREPPQNGSADGAGGGTPEGDRQVTSNSRILVNPDFEILIYPDAPAEASWMVSFFADRLDSERVRRYRLTRESLKRGIAAGWTREEIIGFLSSSVHGTLPANVAFSLKEWTDGIELVRKQKGTLLRASTAGGAERAAGILEAAEIPHERLNETTILVRAGKGERALEELQGKFQEGGLLVE